ncbi:N-acetylmuramoyl-L-alanine amidase [Oceanibium sediminis]|uniref:N-acetylmuramoyl-L-alanine amidase n=1 Tax=Oceanibium sediminis TaxID=2026339 RepID=UPI000DD32D60|nr:N-acetylmuramoyl-L-alanine amidase [Oceanibium sediminis]
MFRTVFLALLCAGGFAASVAAQSVTRLTSIDASLLSGTALSFDIPEGAGYRAFVLTDPARLVIDVESDRIETPAPAEGAIARLRAGRLNQGWSRMVAELAHPAVVGHASVRGRTLEVKLERAGFARMEAASKLAYGAEVVALDRGGVLAEETPLPRIVLDPGHGGIDPGAIRDGVAEKDIALAFGLELARALRATGRFDVVLTREDDRFLLLDDRVAIARGADARLFLSLHANTVTRGIAQGAALYVPAEQASDPATAALAVLENRADAVAGVLDTQPLNDIALTLLDMARPATRSRATLAAEALLDGLSQSAGVIRKNPLRAADFRVLRAPDMPSVLLELGFLSDDTDRRNMTSDAWRRQVAQALVASIDRWIAADQDFLALMQR